MNKEVTVSLKMPQSSLLETSGHSSGGTSNRFGKRASSSDLLWFHLGHVCGDKGAPVSSLKIELGKTKPFHQG